MRGTGLPIEPLNEPLPHLRVDVEGGDGVFIIIPGLGIPAGFYKKFAVAIASKGFHCRVLELRGQGFSPLKPGRRVNFGYTDLLHDLHRLVRHVEETHRELPIYLLGHSLGGQLALLHAARFPGEVERLLLVASGTPFYGYYTGRTRMLIRIAPLLFRLLGRVMGYVPGRLVGFGGNEARGVMEDWIGLATRDRLDLANDAFDYEERFRSLKATIDHYGFDHDELAPEAAARGLLARCPMADVHYRLLLSDALGFRAGHFNWVHHGEALLPFFLQRFSERKD